MCRALLRIFVGNIPALLKFVRKVPTHDTKCKTIFCNVGMIPTSVEIILTQVGTIPTLLEIIPTLYIMCRNLSYKIQQCGNISYKISLHIPFSEVFFCLLAIF